MCCRLGLSVTQKTGGQSWSRLLQRGILRLLLRWDKPGKNKWLAISLDASEETPNTVDEVLNLLEEKSEIPLSAAEREELTVALRLLNHHFAPDRETYIHRVKDNPLATAVKLHDLTHNMDLSRLPNPTEKDYERVARYKKE